LCARFQSQGSPPLAQALCEGVRRSRARVLRRRQARPLPPLRRQFPLCSARALSSRRAVVRAAVPATPAAVPLPHSLRLHALRVNTHHIHTSKYVVCSLCNLLCTQSQGNIPDAVLCFEAELQRHTDSSEAWRMLGLSHAENDQVTYYKYTSHVHHFRPQG
jgi:hypothetical protein